MKSAREAMEIVNAYQAVGSYRGAAALCGATPKTVKRVLQRRQTGQVGRRPPPPRARNTAAVTVLLAERVRATDGRISAKRLLPLAQAVGYAGSARTLRRAVAEAKMAWRKQRRTYRPWVPVPGEHLVIDWGTEGDRQIFCAVLPWSRYRFVRFAADQKQATTLRLVAECFEEVGGAPAVVLADRMGCLKAGVVAGGVVPHPDYVGFATHYGFRPDFCEAASPISAKASVVEALVGYAKRDLVVPTIPDGGWPDLVAANRAAQAWCAEVNGQLHSEIAAIPQERLVTERRVLRPLPVLRPPLRHGELRKVDRLGTIRFGSARYLAPQDLVGRQVEVAAEAGMVCIRHAGAEVIRHAAVAPGEVAGGDLLAPDRRPTRGVRPRTATEVAFLGMGAVAEAFLRAAAAAGAARLASELTAILDLEAGWGRERRRAALERATRFRRAGAADVRAILAAGAGVPTPERAGAALMLALPAAPVRPLSAYALEVG